MPVPTLWRAVVWCSARLTLRVDAVFAFQTKYDFTGAGPYLAAVLLGLICFSLIVSLARYKSR